MSSIDSYRCFIIASCIRVIPPIIANTLLVFIVICPIVADDFCIMNQSRYWQCWIIMRRKILDSTSIIKCNESHIWLAIEPWLTFLDCCVIITLFALISNGADLWTSCFLKPPSRYNYDDIVKKIIFAYIMLNTMQGWILKTFETVDYKNNHIWWEELHFEWIL